MSALTEKTIAIIPARGGSKGVPGKNLRALLGKPLIAHSIEQALASQCVDRCYVSTDNPEISQVALACGAEVIHRPDDISTDHATSESALCHVLEELDRRGEDPPTVVVFLQCTSPIRAPADIDDAVCELGSSGADSLVSVSPFHRIDWEHTPPGPVAVHYDYRSRQRRQDLVPQFVENGSIYVFRPEMLRDTGNRLGGKLAMHVMSEAAAQEIDTEEDFLIVEALMNR